MRAVVDTNVIAYYVLGTSEVDAEVREFWRRVEDPMSPALWEADGSGQRHLDVGAWRCPH